MIGGVEQDDTEYDSDGGDGQPCGEVGASESAGACGDFEEAADADVGEAFLDVCRGRAGGCGNHGDQRGSDGVANVDAEGDGQQRNDHHSAAQAGDGAEEAGDERAGSDDGGEFQDGHGGACRVCEPPIRIPTRPGGTQPWIDDRFLA